MEGCLFKKRSTISEGHQSFYPISQLIKYIGAFLIELLQNLQVINLGRRKEKRFPLAVRSFHAKALLRGHLFSGRDVSFQNNAGAHIIITRL